MKSGGALLEFEDKLIHLNFLGDSLVITISLFPLIPTGRRRNKLHPAEIGGSLQHPRDKA